MKSLQRLFYIFPINVKAFEWGKLLAIAGSAQISVQLIGFLSGLFVIRLLPTNQYAYYTLANSMLGIMTVLADGGITNGVLAQGGKVWSDKHKLGVVLSTGLSLRRQFTLVSLLVMMPVLFYLLNHHGANWLTIVLILVSLIPAFYTSLIGSLLEVTLKLRQDVISLQKIQVGATVGRFIFLSTTLLVIPWAFIAIFASVLSQTWANIQIKKKITAYADQTLEPDPAIKKEILRFSKRLMPGIIYYCLSGQITLWLLSIFGSTEAIAQIGALGRLSMALNLLSVLFSTLILPRFARLPSEASLLLSRYLQIIFLILFLNACLVFLVWLYPNQLLWLLGKEYSHLQNEVVLNIVVSCLGLMAGVCYGLFTSRGWSINPFVAISINVTSIILAASFLNVSTIKGILYFNLFIVSIQLLMNGFYCAIKIIRSQHAPSI